MPNMQGHWKAGLMFFRQLSSEEEEKFKQWARDNYKPFDNINTAWHPAVQEECAKINRENSSFVPDKEDPSY